MCTLGCERFNLRSRRLTAVSAKERTHIDQASDAAAPRLIPPTLRSCSLTSSVTTPLYRRTVSQALRQTLRGEVPKGYPPAPATTRARGHGDRSPSMRRWGTTVLSPASVLMVNTDLTPSQSDENGF